MSREPTRGKIARISSLQPWREKEAAMRRERRTCKGDDVAHRLIQFAARMGRPAAAIAIVPVA